MPNVPTNTVVVDNLASGIDRNDGTKGKGGTPSGVGQIIVNAPAGETTIDNIPIEELDDSPTIERAEQCTAKHSFRLANSEAKNRLAIYGRGALTIDSELNYFRVLSSSIQYQKAGKALLSITSESLSFDSPPDEFVITPIKLGLDIMKHPRYFYALMPTNQIPNYVGTHDTNLQIIAKQSIIRAIQAYRENPIIPTSANIINMVGQYHDTVMSNFTSGAFTITINNPNFVSSIKATDPDPIGTLYSAVPYPPVATANGQKNPITYTVSFTTTSNDPNGSVALALAAAKEIIGKLWRNEDSPMVNGLEVTWDEYYFRPTFMNLGGYIEDPISQATPALPDYFYSPDYPPDPSTTIFDMIANFNPQCFSSTGKKGGAASISWLRDADVDEYSRTWFKITRKWLGAPIGAWDADIYSSGDRPSSPTDYRNLLM